MAKLLAAFFFLFIVFLVNYKNSTMSLSRLLVKLWGGGENLSSYIEKAINIGGVLDSSVKGLVCWVWN